VGGEKMENISILDYERISNLLEDWRKHIEYLIREVEDFLGDTMNRNARLDGRMENLIVTVLIELNEAIKNLEELVSIIDDVKKGLAEVYINE